MFSRVKITDPGDTELLVGGIVERRKLLEENEKAVQNKGKEATFEQLLMGITKVSLTTESFLSASSFQETARVLIDSAIVGKEDSLRGLKENVIIGRLIPAGTGLKEGLE
jgi:DNA-directed RNA polymerase subunit beta'